jgi:hypothetical protein
MSIIVRLENNPGTITLECNGSGRRMRNIHMRSSVRRPIMPNDLRVLPLREESPLLRVFRCRAGLVPTFSVVIGILAQH